ncbi:hypothetical protein NF717_12230, partial [Lactococcus formosensis]
MHIITKVEQERVPGSLDDSNDGDNENVAAPSLSNSPARRPLGGAPGPTSTAIYAKRHTVFDEQHEA